MSPESDARDRRKLALRLALVVTLGLVLETWRGAILPPLAAVIAIQLLTAAPARPSALMAALLLVVVAGAAGLAYLVASLTTDYPGLDVIGIGLLYLWGFALACHPRTAAPGALVLTMSIVVTSFAAASTLAALALTIELTVAVMTGLALVFLVHALFPHRGDNMAAADPPASVAPARASLSVGSHALLATLILLPLHLYLTADGLAAIIILMTTATMLRQPGLVESTRYAASFVCGNAAGAALAAVNVLILALHPEWPLLVALAAVSALLLAGQFVRSPRHAAVWVAGCVSYTMLFGLTLSPLPLADGVAVIARVLMIIVAALYALAGVSLLLPLFRRSLRPARQGDRSDPSGQSAAASSGA